MSFEVSDWSDLIWIFRGKTRPHVFVNGAGDGGSYILVPAGNKVSFKNSAL